MSELIYDVQNQHCPSRKVLEMISDKWSILIIVKLSEQVLRFGELRREVGGISQKVLTDVLKTLEKNGIISRVAYSGLPLKVEYSLTPLGHDLSHLLGLITSWSEQNIHRIQQAQQDFLP